MADLAFDTALTQVEQALQTTLLVALGKRITVADNTALKALASAGMKHGKLAHSTGAGYTYRFDRYSTTADNATTVLRPTDAPTAGRWLRTTATSATGYLNAVDLYEGEAAADEILARFKQQRPCVVINWIGNEWTPRSMIPGALYQYRPRFALWIVSGNMRGEGQAITGSQITSEAARDPGANRIVGDVREVLATSNLGQTGVQSVYIGRESRVISSNAPNMHDRLMVYGLEIEVRASVHNPDTDLVTPDVSGGIRARYNLMNTDTAGEFDASNYAVAGLTVAIGQALNATVAAGTIYIDGASVSVPERGYTFAANKVTYRDVNGAGDWDFTATEVGADAPTVRENYVRVGATVTNATHVVFDRVIAAAEIPVWSVDAIDLQ